MTLTKQDTLTVLEFYKKHGPVRQRVSVGYAVAFFLRLHTAATRESDYAFYTQIATPEVLQKRIDEHTKPAFSVQPLLAQDIARLKQGMSAVYDGFEPGAPDEG